MPNAVPDTRVFVNSLPNSGGGLLSRVVELAGIRRCRPTLIRRAQAGIGLRAGRPDTIHHEALEGHLAYRAWRARGGKGLVFPIGTTNPAHAPLWLLDRWLESVREGQHVVGHVPYSPEAAGMLADHEMCNVLMLRDPRAVVIDTMEQMQRPEHELAEDMGEMGFEARLEFVLQGGYAPHAGCEIVGFLEALDAMLAWSEEPLCEVVLYEDLVGPLGGGDAEAQTASLRRVLAHMNVEPTEERLRRVRAGVFDESARLDGITTIDAWREQLSPPQVTLVSERLREAVDAVEAYGIAHVTI